MSVEPARGQAVLLGVPAGGAGVSGPVTPTRGQRASGDEGVPMHTTTRSQGRSVPISMPIATLRRGRGCPFDETRCSRVAVGAIPNRGVLEKLENP